MLGAIDFTIDQIRPTYRFKETSQETVPQAIRCFLEASGFEDAIRNAISIGGDSDTIAAIIGAIAEAYYGIPEDIEAKVFSYLDSCLRQIFDEWTAFLLPQNEQYKLLTKYIGRLAPRTTTADVRLSDWENFPYREFKSEWPSSGFPRQDFQELLPGLGLVELEQPNNKKVDELNAEQVLALLTAAFIKQFQPDHVPAD